MAEIGSFDLGFRLDMKQILVEAQHRWLRPAEICEILRNYQKFHISPEAPNKPVSGSVFLFDRKVLRYFRKDGHNWRKKKDGKTIKEAHEKLKVGSVDMLHCYYAHGADNENFQRRSYWLLEQDLMHIVFVHYLEVKGNKSNASYVRNSDTPISNSENGSTLTSNFHGTSPTSTFSSGYEDAETAEDNHQASSRVSTYPEILMTGNSHSAPSNSYNQLSSSGNQNIPALHYGSCTLRQRDESMGEGNILPGALTTDLGSWQGNSTTGEIVYKLEPDQGNWQHSVGDQSLYLYNPNMNQNMTLNLLHNQESTSFVVKSLPSDQGSAEPFYESPNDIEELSELTNFQVLLSNGNAMNPNLVHGIRNENYPFLKKPLISSLKTGDSLQKVDSFSSWMAKELGEAADDLNMQSNSGISWSNMGSEYESNMTAQLQADADTLSPSIPKDQLFSITDCSPNWAYSNMETKVLIEGTFLKSEEELSTCRWSVMFGEVEVPAEVLADEILCCSAPLHQPGPVPFYVTCSNRLACSEIREFEYRVGPVKYTCAVGENGDYVIVMHLYQRFEAVLCLGTIRSPVNSCRSDFETQNMLNRILLLMEEESNEEASLTSVNHTSQIKFTGQLLLEKQLKHKFYSWLLDVVAEDGKGVAVLDEQGQSVLHLGAALGFNWVFQPILASGVSIDFRDANGWTALHWAAFYGREETVAVLVALGASPGPLTHPSAEHPCKTPADLASSSGHKGISGYLAEGILTTHLSKLEVSDQLEMNTIHNVSERLAVPPTGQEVPDTLSLKDSLAAVCNATQAAARIHQILRIKSFQRKQLIEQGSDDLPTSDAEHAVSLVAGKKTSRFGHFDGVVNSAALQIQKKFRGWKKRKEFLLIRQKVVKIQAHVRGHQVRKKYKPIIWSVGILEKVILRWRRKGSGLRGFRSEEVVKGLTAQSSSPQEDDYDFLKEGRKQSEERMQKALSRVKSMAQYPEARAQYRRLLTAAEGLRENKDAADMMPSNSEDMMYPEDDLIDIEALWDDDALMSLAFQ